jgi:copper homeostasis protein
VIVTSLHEAIEAELGGADRLELVCSLESGGFTPPVELVQRVVERVSIPVRVMLRENASMATGRPDEIGTLQSQGRALAHLPIDGLVLGFIKDGALDLTTTKEVLAVAPNCRATFHRAFDSLRDQLCALHDLKQLPQIDRVLTSGGEGSWAERKTRLLEWQRAAAPQIKIIVAAGLCASSLAETSEELRDIEVHVGRAARVPQVTSGTVSRSELASLKRLLG